MKEEKTKYNKVKPAETIASDIPEKVVEKQAPVEKPKTKTGVVTGCTNLNVREKGAANATIIRTIPESTKVTVLDTNKDWTNVRLADDTVGYVMTQYLKIK